MLHCNSATEMKKQQKHNEANSAIFQQQCYTGTVLHEAQRKDNKVNTTMHIAVMQQCYIQSLRKTKETQ